MSDSRSAILAVENLSVFFRDHNGSSKGKKSAKKIIDDLSFSLAPKQTLGIVGESGSGKSVSALSLLKLIPAPPLMRISGRAEYGGRNLLAMSVDELQVIRGREIAFIFQEPMSALNPVFTIGEQIIEMIRQHLKLDAHAAREKARELLKEVGISEPELRMKNYPHQMSGGMRQRAMIAMALSCEPKILIADEPTTALDVTVQAQILDLFRKLKAERDMAILFITHDLGVIAEIADHVLVMRDGVCLENAPVADIFNFPQHPYTRSLIELLPAMKVNNV